MKRLVIFLLTSVAWSLQAEPWISNKVTKNCAACHAPSRINKKPIGRRCTLSCQGCHVNPNGGGIRNFYGKWQQERWLKSFSFKSWHDKKPPAPGHFQSYVKNFEKWLEGKDPKEIAKTIKKKPRLRYPKKTARLKSDLVKPKLEKYYHEQKSNRVKYNASSETEFLTQIPEDDPYRLERNTSVYGGGDLRLMQYSLDQEGATERQNFFWFMAADLGLRWRPVKEYVSLVFESRFLNAPQNSSFDDVFSESQVRSGYLIIDDLAYNSYFMGGLYRPMFGHYNVDHTSLVPTMTGFTQRSVYRGIGFGTAPNVPFLNVNYIFPGTNTAVDRDKGLVITLGGRFVSYGLSAQLSYWATTNDATGEELKKNMYSLNLGSSLGRLTSNFEFVVISREFSPGSKDLGAVLWLENRLRLWRENYLVGYYGKSNVSRSLKEGSGQEIMIGTKSFLLSGTEIEILYIKRNDVAGTVESNSTAIQTQLHLFF